MRYSKPVTTSIPTVLRRCAATAAAFVASTIAMPANAQVVRGNVLASARGEHVRGAVVLLLDSADDVVRARALTSERGEFVFLAPDSGQYRLRAQRLGFRPTTTPPLHIAGD